MLSLRVGMFGKLVVQQNNTVWRWEDCGRIQEIFCYLMVHRFARHSREQLAELFWCNRPAAVSKKNLRQALWQLQCRCTHHLGESAAPLLEANSAWVYLNPEVELWTDVSAFEQAYESSCHLEEFDAVRLQQVQQAVGLYHGDLLEGWHQDWCLCERERLQNMYLMMLDRLIGYCEKRQAYDAGLEYAERILKYDPARECTHQQLMRLKYLTGDRTGAMRQYEHCVKALRQELGIQPGRRTRELFDRIRTDPSSSPVAPDFPDLRNYPPSQLPLPELLSQLKTFQNTLGLLQQQAQQWIELIERLNSNQ